jgi:hypothetical protein
MTTTTKVTQSVKFAHHARELFRRERAVLAFAGQDTAELDDLLARLDAALDAAPQR